MLIFVSMLLWCRIIYYTIKPKPYRIFYTHYHIACVCIYICTHENMCIYIYIYIDHIMLYCVTLLLELFL